MSMFGLFCILGLKTTSCHLHCINIYIYITTAQVILSWACVSLGYFGLPFCLLSSLCCTSRLQQKGFSVLWRSDERRLCLFRGGRYNSWSLGSPEHWDWEGARCTIEPTDRGSVMGGRGARLQQGTKLHFNSTVTCLNSVDLRHVVLLMNKMMLQWIRQGNDLWLTQGSCSQALQQGVSVACFAIDF